MYSRRILDFLKPLGVRVLPKQVRSRLGRAIFTLYSLRYAGDQVECPCCGGKFRHFLPLNGRPDALCPRCLSAERHRLLWLFYRDRTNLFREPVKLLHIAPELSSQPVFEKMPNIDYLSGDLDSPLADVSVDITQMQFADGTFDALICNHVLEHVPHDQQAMREIYRVLKPGGWAVLQSPNDPTLAKTLEDFSITDPAERKRLYGHHDHVRLYGRDYRDRLQASGFDVRAEAYGETLPQEKVRYYGIQADEVIYYCVKPAISN